MTGWPNESLLKITGSSKIGWTEDGQQVLKSLNLVADKMARHAHQIGSCDNITVTILLLLRSPTEMPAGQYELSDSEEDYPSPVANSGHAAPPAWSLGPQKPPVKLTLDPARIGGAPSGPLSPSALSSEILSAMSRPSGCNAIGKKQLAALHGNSDAGSKSVDQDDDLMSFLLDDSNF